MKKLKRFKYLLEGSVNSNNSGYSPLLAKYEKCYLETSTGDETITTDLEERKHRRAQNLFLFNETYIPLYFETATVSILTGVIDCKQYPYASTFINNFKRRLKRRNIDMLGYLWQRDVGDTLYKHFHVLIATSRMRVEILAEVITWGQSDKGKFSIEALQTRGGMKKYLERKELYAAPNEKSWARSLKFSIPPNSKAIESVSI